MNQKYEIELHYQFTNALKLIRNCASKICNRPLLTTVSVSIKKGKVLIEATDSYQMISAEIFDLEDETIDYKGAAFSAEFIDFIIKEFKNQTGFMILDVKNELLTFRHGKDGLCFTTSRFPGNYPDLNHIFNKKNEVELKKKWYQLFSIIFDEDGKDYAKITIKHEEESKGTFDVVIPKERFNPILRYFRHTSDVKLYHQYTIQPIILDFNNMWKFTVVLLPVRTV